MSWRDDSGFLTRVWWRYVAVARSRAGAASLLCAIILAASAWLQRDFTQALITGVLAYFFFLTSFAIGRK